MDDKEETTNNFPPKLMIVLSWLFLVAAIIVLATEKKHRESRVQAWQAVVFKGIGYFLLSFVWIFMIIGFPVLGIAGEASGLSVASFGLMCCFLPVGTLAAVVWQVVPWVAVLMILADKEFKIPLVYRWVQRLA